MAENVIVIVQEDDNSVTITSPGPPGSQGPPGPAGGSAYTHDQPVAASQWNINHNLGRRPHVTLIGTDNSKFYGRVEYPDLNNVSVVLNSPVAGKAELS